MINEVQRLGGGMHARVGSPADLPRAELLRCTERNAAGKLPPHRIDDAHGARRPCGAESQPPVYVAGPSTFTSVASVNADSQERG